MQRSASLAGKRTASYSAILFIVLTEAVLLFKTAMLTPIDSDHVQNVLEVSDVLKGNVLLHGWILASDNFYLSDMPIALLMRLVFGKTITAIYAGTFLVYITFLVGAAILVWRCVETTWERVLGLAALLFYLGTPGVMFASISFVSAQHIATLTDCLLAWVALQIAHQTKLPQLRRFGFAFFSAFPLSQPPAILLRTLFTCCLRPSF